MTQTTRRTAGWRAGMVPALLVLGCGGGGQARPSTVGQQPGTDSSAGTEAAETAAPPSSESTTGGGPPDATTTPPDPDTTGAPTEPIDCVYASTTFGQPLQLLDVMDPASSFRLTFSVPGVADPTLLTSATLIFDSHDADHPGEEGFIYVNDSAPIDLPADRGWDNAGGTGQVDVLASIAAGSNQIEFGPGPLDRSHFSIGNVALAVTGLIDDCEDLGGSDSGGTVGVEQTVHYSDATYTQRNNWVWRCQPGIDYAFTAASREHIPTDCEGLYAPDGSAHGTATFHFADVVEDDYLVQVHAYHTWNRNPNGAIVIVDGTQGLVQQRTTMEGESYFATADWGVAHLSGDIDIVLDSAQGGYASDAVTWVRIVPQ